MMFYALQVLGRELLLHLADHLCTAYLAGDADIKSLVDSTRIHLLPSMNPDGWKIATDNVSFHIRTGSVRFGFCVGRKQHFLVDFFYIEKQTLSQI
jgi:hypothetical protein